MRLIFTQLLVSLQVGACIVNKENKVVGIGYNGMPIGCNDDVMPWNNNVVDGSSETWLKSKLPYGKVCMLFLYNGKKNNKKSGHMNYNLDLPFSGKQTGLARYLIQIYFIFGSTKLLCGRCKYHFELMGAKKCSCNFFFVTYIKNIYICKLQVSNINSQKITNYA